MTLIKGLLTQAVAIVGELHQLIEEERWQEVDRLARERWETLRDSSLLPLLSQLDEPLEWFVLMERVDAWLLSWLTDEAQRERIKGVFEAMEGRVDKLVHHGVGLILDRSQERTQSSPLLDRLARHESTIQHWLSFLLFELFADHARADTSRPEPP